MMAFDNCFDAGLLQIELVLVARVDYCAINNPKAEE